MKREAVIRIRVLTGLILFFALILIGRLYQIQVINGENYLRLGEKQYVHTSENIYDRGSIFFTTKDGELIAAATNQSGYILAVNPGEISDAAYLYSKIKDYLTIDEETFMTRATLPDRSYVVLDDKLTEEKERAIEAMGIEGLQLFRNRWRYYPGESLSARTVGFVGYSGTGENEKPTGRYGLERYYEDLLSRESEKLSVNFFAEVFSNLGELVFDSKDSRQGDVVTTLEPTVSRVLAQELAKVQNTYKSKLTGGVIINPKTGEVYALDAVPAFDLNDRSGAIIEDFRNPLIEDVHEFGSIIKALTMAAGLDSGAVSPSTTYYDAGYIDLNTFTIKNYDGKGRGTVDMQQVLNQSLNTGVAYVVTKMGKDKFRDYFLNLKLGSETGIDLPNETHGLVDNLNSPRDVEYATASFGQGIAMTALETVRALSTLGNGGILITPHIAKTFIYQDKTKKDVIYPEGERVFKEETSEEISRMLVRVVDEALLSGSVALPNYTIAAKTGTAQIANKEDGGYYEDKFLHSFFGYFPAYDPEFLVFLYTVEPQNVRFASETLTLPFMDIVKFLINYYDVPPDR